MKIEVLREVRSITGLGLKEAKDLVEAAPKNVYSAKDGQAAVDGDSVHSSFALVFVRGDNASG
jgi:ribosomal protein L7/L12